jgi:hypothetical protein
MALWFRMYEEVLDDPKVQRLDGETFKGWVNLLALAARNDGKLPPIADMAFALRMSDSAAITLVERLLNGGLIDRVNGGANGYTYAPHAWDKRQYKSDTSTERVKRFRKRCKPVTVTPPEPEPEPDIPLDKSNGANQPEMDPDKAFWANAKSYLGAGKASLVGRWVRDHGRAETAKAITAAQIERAVDPVPYIEKVLRQAKSAPAGDMNEWYKGLAT